MFAALLCLMLYALVATVIEACPVGMILARASAGSTAMQMTDAKSLYMTMRITQGITPGPWKPFSGQAFGITVCIYVAGAGGDAG